MIVRWACDRCSRFWPTEAELGAHRCVDVRAVLEAAERLIDHCDAPGEAVIVYTDRPEWRALVSALRGEGVPA